MGCGPIDLGSNPSEGVNFLGTRKLCLRVTGGLRSHRSGFESQQGRMVYDAALPLAHRFEPDGSYSSQCRARLDETLWRYNNNEFSKIIVTGGCANPELPFTHATALASFFLHREVPARNILAEELALDTFGQAFFTKLQIVQSRGLNNLLVVTHNYHGERTQTFFNFIYHDTAHIEYAFVQLELADEELLAHEKESLAAFKTMFSDIKPGDDKAILERLLEAHPYYSKPNVARKIRKKLKV